MTLINENYGVVRWVSSNGGTIKIRLPRGGTATARNSGFEVGDVVAFTLDPTGTKVVKVLHKYVADLMVEIGKNPYLREAITIEEEPNEYNPGAENFENYPGDRSIFAQSSDSYGAEHRAYDGIWANYATDSDENDDTPWPFD